MKEARVTGEGVWTFTTTKWLRPKAQGCGTLLPWGRRRAETTQRGCTNPNGVEPTPTGLRRGSRGRCTTNAAAVGDDAMAGRNPFRVGPNELGSLGTTPFPRVAEYRNPGLWDETPSGLLAAHR